MGAPRWGHILNLGSMNPPKFLKNAYIGASVWEERPELFRGHKKLVDSQGCQIHVVLGDDLECRQLVGKGWQEGWQIGLVTAVLL